MARVIISWQECQGCGQSFKPEELEEGAGFCEDCLAEIDEDHGGVICAACEAHFYPAETGGKCPNCGEAAQ